MIAECNMLGLVRNVGRGDWMVKCALGILAALGMHATRSYARVCTTISGGWWY